MKSNILKTILFPLLNVFRVYSDEARHDLELLSTTWLIDEFEQNLKSVANYRSAMNHLLNEGPEVRQYLKQNLVVLTGDFPTWKYNKKITAEVCCIYNEHAKSTEIKLLTIFIISLLFFPLYECEVVSYNRANKSSTLIHTLARALPCVPECRGMHSAAIQASV